MKVSKWDERFLRLALEVSSWSKDPSTKAGAVITKGNRIVSLGFNGFPRKVEDREEYIQNREEKLLRIIHAEENAILFAKGEVEGATIYVVPIPPCSHCAALLVQVGISRIVAPSSYPDRWAKSIHTGFSMFSEAGVEVVLTDILE